jgi:CRP-like cAMP-binding protein
MPLLASQVPGVAENLSPEEARDLDELVPIRNFKKGTVLLEAGKVATESYYCLTGCVHLYYNVDGNERTTAFYTEGQSIASIKSFLNQVPADHYLACVEDCTPAVWSYTAEKELFRRHPRLESFCRITVESDFGTAQEALASFITKTPEQRYLDLMTARPELVQRVPQYLLASYLGVTPESLSRIRKRIVSKAVSK